MKFTLSKTQWTKIGNKTGWIKKEAKKVPIVNNKSFMLIDEKGNKDIFINCEYCGKPITTTSAFGMDCEDHCGEKAYKKLIATDPKIKKMDDFLKSIMPKECGGEGNDDSKEECSIKLENLFNSLK